MDKILNKLVEEKAKMIRTAVLDMMLRSNQGHPGSVYSIVEIIATLYYGSVAVLNNPLPKNLRDKLIISKGHATHAVYPVLEDLGYIPSGSCSKFGTKEHNAGPLRMFGNIKINGVDATTGSLGHGVGMGAGFALADKLDGKPHDTFVILSEGEMYEGSVWEGAIFAAHHKLNNLIVILDRNRNIILGDTESCLKLDPVDQKWAAFGWNCTSVDGHDIDALSQSILEAKQSLKPTCIIANTTKGKGNLTMENAPEWHYWHPSRVEELVKGQK
jgi:transketolase